MEKVGNAKEENLERENIMKIWKDCTIEDEIAIIEEAKQPSSMKQWIPDKENCPDVACDFIGFTTGIIKQDMKEIVDMAK